MEVTDYLCRCRHPKVIKNCHGEMVVASCGKCVDCKNNILKRYTQKAVRESQKAKHVYFITLTYNDECAPEIRVCHNRDKKSIYYVDNLSRPLHPNVENSVIRHSPTFGKILHAIDTDRCSYKLFQKFMNKSYKKSNIYKPKNYPYLYVLRKKDLQDFIKRLRFQLRSKFNAEIRYFAVGEYGPKHFRPHYHIILYFDDSRLTKKLRTIVDQCWQYGITDTQPARSGKGCSSYLASYLNAFTRLPYFLNGKQISPFCLHSQFLGVQDIKSISSFIYEYERYPFDKIDISINSTVYSISLQSEIKSLFFPRCYNHELQSKESRRFLYYSFRTFQTKAKSYKISDIIEYIFTHPNDLQVFTFKKFLDVDCDFFGSPREFHANLKLLNTKENDLFITYYNRFYNALLTSRKVFDLFPSFMPGETSELYKFYEFVDKIDDFYYQLQQHKLKQQYEIIEDYLTRVNPDTDNLDIFFPISDIHDIYDYLYEEDLFVKQCNVVKDYDYEKKIKHKKLNDENEIFAINF